MQRKFHRKSGIKTNPSKTDAVKKPERSNSAASDVEPKANAVSRETHKDMLTDTTSKASRVHATPKRELTTEEIYKALEEHGTTPEDIKESREGVDTVLKVFQKINRSNKNITEDELLQIKGAVAGLKRVKRLERMADRGYDKMLEYKARAARFSADIMRSPESLKIAQTVENLLVNNGVGGVSIDDHNEIDDLLLAYNLKLDAPRRLQVLCDFQQIKIKGVQTMSKSELKNFLATHPGHHLGIFSVERNGNLICFSIQDLIMLLRSSEKNTLELADLFEVTEQEWDDLQIQSSEGGVTFTGEELLRALEWHTAYTQLLNLFATLNDLRQIKLLRKLASSIVPSKKRNPVNRALFGFARATWRKFQNVQKLLGFKLILDILNGIVCILVLWNSVKKFMEGDADASSKVMKAINTFFLGSIVQKIITFVKKVIIEGNIEHPLALIGSYGTGLFDYFGLGFVGNVFQSVLGAWTWIAPVASKGLVYSSAGLGVGTILSTGGVWYLGYGAAAISAPLGIGMALGTLVINWYTRVAEQEAKANAVIMGAQSAAPTETGFVGPLIALLSTGVVCKVLENTLGASAFKLCNSVARTVLRLSILSALTRTVIDLLIMLARLAGFELWKGYETKCETSIEKDEM